MISNNFNQMANTPDPMSILKSVQKDTLLQLNCMRIGVITKIISNNEIFCSITNKMLVGQNEDGTSVWEDYPQIYCRVWYMGSGASGIDYPLEIGAPCILFFNDREMDSYFKTGEVSTLSSLRMHSLNDCMAIPLYQPKTAENTLTIRANNIELTGTLTINGKPYLSHTHSNGNQGKSTGGIDNAV